MMFRVAVLKSGEVSIRFGLIGRMVISRKDAEQLLNALRVALTK